MDNYEDHFKRIEAAEAAYPAALAAYEAALAAYEAAPSCRSLRLFGPNVPLTDQEMAIRANKSALAARLHHAKSLVAAIETEHYCAGQAFAD